MTSDWAMAALSSATTMPVKLRRKIKATNRMRAPMDAAAPAHPADTDHTSATPTTAGAG